VAIGIAYRVAGQVNPLASSENHCSKDSFRARRRTLPFEPFLSRLTEISWWMVSKPYFTGLIKSSSSFINRVVLLEKLRQLKLFSALTSDSTRITSGLPVIRHKRLRRENWAFASDIIAGTRYSEVTA
jgi:hypothetical protein